MFSPAPANIVTLTAPDKISRARWTFLARWQGCLGVLRGAAMLFWSVFVCQSAIAQYRAEIGYDALLAERGEALEDGSGVEVAIAEAFVNNRYLPNFDDPEFSGKTLVDASNGPQGTSGHANSVTRRCVGNTSSISAGVTQVRLYQANDWIDRVLGFATGADPQLPNYQIQNNSWIGNDYNNSEAINILTRIDYVVDKSDVLMLGGTTNNNNGVPKVMGNGYNAMIVGRTSGNHGSGLTTINGAGRVKPDIVAPATNSSLATPTVASAAAILYEAGQGTAATRSETMRAILMAGATKAEFPSWDRTTTRPLDEVFGAGELNIYNSYQILQGGPVAPAIADPTFAVGLSGWSYVEEITAADTLFFKFEVDSGFVLDELSISLNWNLKVNDLNPDLAIFDPETSLANLDMHFFDSSDSFLGSLVDASLSSVDNVEYLYLRNLAAGVYTLQISGDGVTDFGLAWHGSLQAVPEPGSWLLLSFTAATLAWRKSARNKRQRKHAAQAT